MFIDYGNLKGSSRSKYCYINWRYYHCYYREIITMKLFKHIEKLGIGLNVNCAHNKMTILLLMIMQNQNHTTHNHSNTLLTHKLVINYYSLIMMINALICFIIYEWVTRTMFKPMVKDQHCWFCHDLNDTLYIWRQNHKPWRWNHIKIFIYIYI